MRTAEDVAKQFARCIGSDDTAYVAAMEKQLAVSIREVADAQSLEFAKWLDQDHEYAGNDEWVNWAEKGILKLDGEELLTDQQLINKYHEQRK